MMQVLYVVASEHSSEICCMYAARTAHINSSTSVYTRGKERRKSEGDSYSYIRTYIGFSVLEAISFYTEAFFLALKTKTKGSKLVFSRRSACFASRVGDRTARSLFSEWLVTALFFFRER